MADKPKRKKKNKKDSQLLIRISGEERESFVALCEELDSSAAREIRRFIRDFLAEHDALPGERPSKKHPNSKRK